MMKELLQKDNYVTRFINPAIKVNQYTNSNNSNSQNSLHKCRTDDLETAWFTKCYLLLLDQVSYVNIYFGLRVMVHCENLQMNMMNVLNIALRSVNGNLIEAEGEAILSSSSVLSRFLTITSSILRIMNYEFMVIILMYQCEQAYRQSERILKTIDMLMTSKRYNRDLKRNLQEFRNLLITRPIRFHAAKFFTMDYTLLVSLNSVVITYTIIMYQNMH